MKNSTVILILVLVSLASCKKEKIVEDFTELSITMERTLFSDSTQVISKLKINTNNDSILEFAQLRIYNENQEKLIDKSWQEAVNQNLQLPESRIYGLTAELYRVIDGVEIIDHQKLLNVDNNRIPKKIQILSAEVSSNVLDPDGYGLYASPNHQVYVDVYKDVYFSEEIYDFDFNLYYLRKAFSPETVSFTFNDFYLNTQVYEDGHLQWMAYDFTFIYPLIYTSGTVIDTRLSHAYLLMNDLFLQTEINETTVYSSSLTDSQNGGAYTAKVNFKWVYE